jgi:radical SAM superfamily enzyme YgiQ (UPF0313 family)
MDVPDLPLVIDVLKAFDNHTSSTDLVHTAWFDDYCICRGIDPGSLRQYLQTIDRFLERTFAQFTSLKFVGFSVWTSNFLTTVMAASHLKRRRNPPFIVAGGPQVTESTNAAQLGLRSGLFDAIVLGEGEETLLSLYKQFSSRGHAVDTNLPGTMQVDRSTGAFVTTPRPLLRMDALPLPDFDEMMIASYRSHTKKRELPYQLSRGCTDKCSFCSEWVFWQHFRPNTADIAVDQFCELVDRYDAEVIQFTDSLLNGTMSRLRQFAERLLSRGKTVPWFGFMRADMDSQTAALIKRAGCKSVFVGIESLSTETLEMMNKRRTEADNLRSLRVLLEAHIGVRAGLIAGFPGDSPNRFVRTTKLLRELQRAFPNLLTVNVEPFIVSPGQPIYKELEKYQLTTTAWPTEVIASSGRYEDIAAAVKCQFNGPNQGVARTGSQRVATMLLGGGEESARRERRAFHEKYEVVQLDLDAFLITMTMHTGVIAGFLVNGAERRDLDRRLSRSDAVDSSSGAIVCDDATVLAWVTSIEGKHHVTTPWAQPSCPPVNRRMSVSEQATVYVSPFMIARTFGDELFVAHTITKALVRLSYGDRTWVSAIGAGATTIAALQLTCDDGTVIGKVAELWRRGCVELCTTDDLNHQANQGSYAFQEHLLCGENRLVLALKPDT